MGHKAPQGLGQRGRWKWGTELGGFVICLQGEVAGTCFRTAFKQEEDRIQFVWFGFLSSALI